ncbi:hypothetical protein Tsubulata_036529 [Turnera subulata]|uniref:mitogen-activated protein kinase kinase kinase n=1 Tax=Turnera subulata TaxID=218843 RepID=A0A9Q0FRS3_9ROSI|nr:hypothetical protein Tsubulata_036529 [Turnera subulata]
MDYWTRGRTLGHGSTATVSLATSLQSGDVFAVKSAEISRSEFLQREQRILSSITSPYVVGYRGCDVSRENKKLMYNLFLEYIPGGTLVDVIQANGGRLEEEMIRHYTWGIVQGLDYLHSNGLVHCDIKGRNILVGSSGAKIADFGCAKRVESGAGMPIGGTPMFMAPEVARGEEQGFAGDIWALGCTIIEMASGGAPWPNANDHDPVSMIYRVGHSGLLPEFPCCLSEQARDFLDKCLRRDPKERWTASQLLKHPFLGESNSLSKQETNSSSNSPTSILDQGVWNSLDEPESLEIINLGHTGGLSSAGERIRGLSLDSGEPSWDWDDSWITVREGSSWRCDRIMGDVEARDDDVFSCDSVMEEGAGSKELLSVLLDINISCRKNRWDSWGDCKYGGDSFVSSSNLYFDRDRDTLLHPVMSRSLLQT